MIRLGKTNLFSEILVSGKRLCVQRQANVDGILQDHSNRSSIPPVYHILDFS
jgi:hypothetical protein